MSTGVKGATPEASTADGAPSAKISNARLTVEEAIDRMPRVGLSRAAWVGLMLAFLFANWDIGVFAVALPSIQVQLHLTGAGLAWPVTLNLVGYAIGAYFFGWISDAKGRQAGLFVTMAILGIGGLITAFSWDAASLSVFRLITGFGMGAVLALVTAYIGEMAPRNKRGSYLALLYVIGGGMNVIAAFSLLPLIRAFPAFGWRYFFAFGALVLFVLLFINKRAIMESPRWLLSKGRAREATDIVRKMEGYARAKTIGDGELLEIAKQDDAHVKVSTSIQILLKRPYLFRLVRMLSFWFIFYIAMYGFGSYIPLFLEGAGLNAADATTITIASKVAPIVIGFVVVGVVERFERRSLAVIGIVAFILGIVLVITHFGAIGAIVGTSLALGGIVFLAPSAYTYTAEVFPTKARSTGAAVCDGIGHLGGAISPFIILPLLTGSGGAVAAGITCIVFLVISAALIGTGIRTKDRSLIEISG